MDTSDFPSFRKATCTCLYYRLDLAHVFFFKSTLPFVGLHSHALCSACLVYRVCARINFYLAINYHVLLNMYTHMPHIKYLNLYNSSVYFNYYIVI